MVRLKVHLLPFRGFQVALKFLLLTVLNSFQNTVKIPSENNTFTYRSYCLLRFTEITGALFLYFSIRHRIPEESNEEKRSWKRRKIPRASYFPDTTYAFDRRVISDNVTRQIEFYRSLSKHGRATGKRGEGNSTACVGGGATRMGKRSGFEQKSRRKRAAR